MDVKEVTAILGQIPWWGWAAGVIGLLTVFGDKKIWEYEADFPWKDGIGKGEVEFEHYTRRPPVLEVELDLEPAYLNRDIEVLRNGQRLVWISAADNTKSRLRYHERYDGERPSSGDVIEIKCGLEILFRGELRAD